MTWHDHIQRCRHTPGGRAGSPGLRDRVRTPGVNKDQLCEVTEPTCLILGFLAGRQAGRERGGPATHRLVSRAGRQHILIEGVEAQAVDLRLMRLDLLRPRCNTTYTMSQAWLQGTTSGRPAVSPMP